MNATTQQAKGFEWMGLTWTPHPDNDGGEGDKALASDGSTAPLSDLMKAIFRGEAVEAKPEWMAPVIPVRLVKAGEIDEVGKARALEKIADIEKRTGATLPKTKGDGLFYDAGTAVMDEAWESERQAFEALPLGEEILPKVRDAIRAENRQDFAFDAWDVRMSKTTGKLGDPKDPSKAWLPTQTGFDSFTHRAGIGKIGAHWPTDIKAATMNALCQRFQDLSKEAAKTAKPEERVEDPRVVLRVQQARGKVFAAVSEAYAKFDGDLVLEALMSALPKGARVTVNYDPDQARGRAEIITLQEEKPVVAEPFKQSFTIGWSDAGKSAVWGDGGLFSARCLNLTRIWTSVGSFSVRHVGSVERLTKKFTEEFERIAAVLGMFSKAYGNAASEELTNAERIEGTEFLQGIYRSLLQRDLVPVKGKREEASAQLAMQAMADENHAGMTRAGIANGITRYAHQVNQDPWVRDELETAAGRILWMPKPVKLDYLAKEVA
jgi:hypothetical protein